MLTSLLFIAALSPLAQCGPMPGHRHDMAPAPHARAPQVNARCPVMGDPVTSDSPMVTVGNRSYAVCCPSCGGKLKADPGKYLHEDGTPRNARPAAPEAEHGDHAGQAESPAPAGEHSGHQH